MLLLELNKLSHYYPASSSEVNETIQDGENGQVHND